MKDDTLKQYSEFLTENLKVKISIRNSGNILAIASVTFGVFEIRNWTISESIYDGSPYFVQPPRFRNSTGRYSFYFFVRDKKLNKIITERIIEAYEEELKINEIEKSIEEIPF